MKLIKQIAFVARIGTTQKLNMFTLRAEKVKDKYQREIAGGALTLRCRRGRVD